MCQLSAVLIVVFCVAAVVAAAVRAGEAEHAKRALAKREKKIPEVDPAWGLENDGS